jgi:hypothetical protein
MTRACPPAHDPSIARYRPRDAAGTVLYQIVQGHLETFLEATRDPESGSGLPRFVEREFRKFLECGIHAHGFVRVRCLNCGDSLAVAFSCKGRAICSSCATRRMSMLAANLVDRVIPRVPVRHWVLSLPFDLRPLVAFRPAAFELVLDTYLALLFEWIRARTRVPQGASARCGAVTTIQRAGGAVNLNPHFHSVILEGVFTEGPRGRPKFVKMKHPTEQEIREIETTIAHGILGALREAGHTDGDGRSVSQDDLTELDAHATIVAASLGNAIGVGDRAGRRVEREMLPASQSTSLRTRGALGFSLFAGDPIIPSRRPALERLCRYLARPAIAQERLTWTPDGSIRYELLHPRLDGTVAVVFTPVEFLEKLAALVPRPRSHLVRFHGVLAPNAAWRRAVVPDPAARAGAKRQSDSPPPKPRPSWIPWAELLRRVFAIDVLECDRCHGRRRVIAFIKDPETVLAILTNLGLPVTAPAIAPARSLGPVEHAG